LGWCYSFWDRPTNTPYIGHPAYKARGGRSAYTLATALFVGGAGLLGYFVFLYLVIPKAAIFTITCW